MCSLTHINGSLLGKCSYRVHMVIEYDDPYHDPQTKQLGFLILEPGVILPGGGGDGRGGDGRGGGGGGGGERKVRIRNICCYIRIYIYIYILILELLQVSQGHLRCPQLSYPLRHPVIPSLEISTIIPFLEISTVISHSLRCPQLSYIMRHPQLSHSFRYPVIIYMSY